MIKNLKDYFFPEYESYLLSMSYEKLEQNTGEEETVLNCTDRIQVDITNDEEVQIVVTRSLQFHPEEIFELKVAYGTTLKFIPEKKDEHNWYNIDLAKEFRNNGEFVTGELMSWISLQIAQITAKIGKSPLILPPMIAQSVQE